MNTTISTPIAFSKILVATDFSDISTEALAYALAIAKQFQSRIKLVHVSKSLSTTALPDDDSDMDNIVRDAAQLEVLGSSLREEGLLVDAINAVGNVRENILACVEKDSSDLVVFGTHGRKGIERILFGSEAEDLARRISCPVLIVGSAARAVSSAIWPPKIILCATNTDHDHWKEPEYAYALARMMKAKLAILTVRNTSSPHPGDSSLPGEPFTHSIPISETAHFHIRCDLEEGEPASTITTVAREKNVDLIVMGATESHWPRSHFGKSVLAGVVTNAPCPVLTIQVQ